MTTLEYLCQAQVDQFYKDGYLVVPHFLSRDQTNTLVIRTEELLDEFTPECHPIVKFTTSDKNHIMDDYFLNSGDKIRYFLEEDAVESNGKLTRDKRKVVNKIGHVDIALHQLDPTFRKVTLENDHLKALVRDLKFHHDPIALQSMVICKQSEIGGAVPEHNDSTFLYTSPPTALGFWIALEKCTPTNGALSFLPGSHLTTPITKRFVRFSEGGAGFERLALSPPCLSGVTEIKSGIANDGVSEGKYVMEACEPGDLVLIHGSILHKSERNTSAHTRYAYTFHMIDSPPYAEYDEKNWLQASEAMPFSRILDVQNAVTIAKYQPNMNIARPKD